MLFAVLFLAASARPLPCNAPGIAPPVVKHRVTPQLGDIRGPASMAIFDVTIDSHGRVRSVRAVRRVPPDLDKKIVKALSLWTFRPASRNGKTIPCTMNLQVIIDVR